MSDLASIIDTHLAGYCEPDPEVRAARCSRKRGFPTAS